MTNLKKIENFIRDNKLSFDEEGTSSLNSDCVIISGFADFLGEGSVDNIKKALQKVRKGKELSTNLCIELERVFDFAYTYDYGSWWKKPEAKDLYKF